MVTLGILLFAILLGCLTLRYDRFGREPWYLIGLALFLGVFSAYQIGYVEDDMLVDVSHADFAQRAAVAAFVEEFTKLSLVVLLAIAFGRHFDDPIDGLVYGSFFGIGCALFEMNTYHTNTRFGGASVINQFGSEVIRFVLHWLTGGLAGFGVGMAKLARPRARSILLGWSAAALAIHFCWDFFCGLPTQGGEAWMTQRLIAVSLMVTAVGMYGWAVCLGESHGRLMYGTHPSRLWGWPFTLLWKQETEPSVPDSLWARP